MGSGVSERKDVSAHSKKKEKGRDARGEEKETKGEFCAPQEAPAKCAQKMPRRYGQFPKREKRRLLQQEGGGKGNTLL